MSERQTKIYYIMPFFLSLIIAVISALIVWWAVSSNSLAFVVIAFIILAVCAVLVVFSFIQVLRFLYYLKKCKEKRSADSDLKGVIIFSGAPRTGKSADGGQTIVNHCLSLQDFNNYRYKVLSAIKKEKELNEDDQREYDELKLAFDFYKEHPDLIPFLASNVPLEINGQKPLPLKGSHFMQDDRLPPCDVFIDESSAQLDIDLYKDRPQDIDEFFRFPCHFLGDRTLIVNCEQDANKSYIAIRRSMWYNKYELGQDWVMSPKRLLWRLERLKRKFLKRKNSENVRLAKRILNMDDKSKLIGFRRFNFIKAGSTENKFIPASKPQCEYTPSGLDYKYDNRVFRNLYQPKDKAVKYDKFEGMLLPANFRDEIIRIVREGKQKVVNYKRKE